MVRELQYRGSFYPEDIEDMKNFITENIPKKEIKSNLKGIIVPHAGWIYSGYTAAKGFSHTPKENTKRIYLIGPSHRFHFNGVATSSYSEYETPFGNFKLDKSRERHLLDIDGVEEIDEAHIFEHSLEVELPFLKALYPKALLIPLVAGSGSTPVLSRILKRSLNEEESFTVISSDLSHFQPYDSAKDRDISTIKSIISGNKELSPHDACGSVTINALIKIIKEMSIKVELIDYTNSGDTAGDKDSVVGYCSMEIMTNG